MRSIKLFFLFLLLLTPCLQFVNAELGDNWNIIDNSIIIDDANVRLELTPHTFTSDNVNVTLKATSKVYDGLVDFIIGFNRSDVMGKKAWYYSNSQKRWMTLGNYYHVSKELLGFTDWYILNDQYMKQGKEYEVKINMEVPINSEGKYFIGLKPSSEGLHQAWLNGHLYVIDPWWDAQWPYAMRITFDNTASTENLINYPVYVNLTRAHSESRFNFTQALANAHDLRLIDSNNVTVLDYEREYYNQSETRGDVWGEVPQIDAGSNTDHIFLYWGNAGAVDGEDAEGVWNSDYKAVWHMNQDDGTILDSTSNNNDGNVVGSAIYGDYWISGGMWFNDTGGGNTDYGKVNGRIVASGNLTVECLWYLNELAPDTWHGGVNLNRIVTENRTWHVSNHGWGNDEYYATFRDGGAGTKSAIGFTPLVANTWNFLAGRYEAGVKVELIQNTTKYTSAHAVLPDPLTYDPDDNADIYINYYQRTGNNTYDEIRLVNTGLSDEWLEADYKNFFDNYITFGIPQAYTPFFQVHVIDIDGNGLFDALVSAWENFNNLILSEKTDVTGYTSQYTPVYGNYTLLVNLDGYETFTEIVNFNNQLIYNVTLETTEDVALSNLQNMTFAFIWLGLIGYSYAFKNISVRGIAGIFGIALGFFFLNDNIIMLLALVFVNIYFVYETLFNS